MDIIYKNPFRILGLLANATEKEIAKRATDLKMLVELGKSPSIVNDFPCFPECGRTVESIEEAKKKIEQAENKLFYSLFWFYRNDSADELALDVLSEGWTEKAIELWEKAIVLKNNPDTLEPKEEEIESAIIGTILIPHLKENYHIRKTLSREKERVALINSLQPFAEEVRINILAEEPCYLVSAEPIGEDDEGQEMELDVEITKADYEKTVQQVLQRKLALPDKDFFHAKNVAVLYLGLSLNGEKTNSKYIQKALYLAGRMFHSDNLLSQYAASFVPPNYRFEWEKVTKSFIDEIFRSVKLLDDNGRLGETAKWFDLFPNESRQHAISKFIAQPIKAIENKISETAEKRKKDPREANVYGNELYESAYEDLLHLKGVLSTSSLQYQNIADELAGEIFSCSIEYFNIHRKGEDNIDPGEDALKLAQYADSITTDIRIKENIREGLPILEEWVEEKPKRDRNKNAELHINYIVKQLEGMADPGRAYPNEMNATKRFLENCEPSLNRLRNILAINSTHRGRRQEGADKLKSVFLTFSVVLGLFSDFVVITHLLFVLTCPFRPTLSSK